MANGSVDLPSPLVDFPVKPAWWRYPIAYRRGLASTRDNRQLNLTSLRVMAPSKLTPSIPDPGLSKCHERSRSYRGHLSQVDAGE